jgi:hypothetical protein
MVAWKPVPVTLAIACLVGWQPALAAGQGEPDAGATPETAFGPIARGVTYAGTIDDPTDVDMFKVVLPANPTSVAVKVAHTNDECEIWAQLVDEQGTQSQTTFVPRKRPMTLSTSVLAGGPFYVVVTTGPFRTCSGSTYSLELSVLPLPLDELTSGDPGVVRRAASSVGEILRCNAAQAKVRRLSVIRRKLIHRLHESHGSARRRLLKRLRKVNRAFRRARRHQNKVCG